MQRLLALLALALAAPVFAASDAAYPAGPRGESVEMLDTYEKKLVQLLDAIPAATMGWRPGEGVRSFTEVFAHVADANFGLPTRVGIAPPEGWSRDNPVEGRVTSRIELREVVPASFAHIRAGILGLSDESLDEEVPWFGDSKITRRAALFFMVKHIAEHEGQLVAYTRINGLVPPWSE